MTTTAFTFRVLLHEARKCKSAGMSKPFIHLFLSGFKCGARLAFIRGVSRAFEIETEVATRYNSFKPGTPGYLFYHASLACVACDWHGQRLDAIIVPNDLKQRMDTFCPKCGQDVEGDT